jgi:hypothetical protein
VVEEQPEPHVARFARSRRVGIRANVEARQRQAQQRARQV